MRLYFKFLNTYSEVYFHCLDTNRMSDSGDHYLSPYKEGDMLEKNDC